MRVQQQGDLRARIIAETRARADKDRRFADDPAFVSPFLRSVEEIEAGQPYYMTGAGFARYGVQVPGDPWDWYELGADDQLRLAPTAHLTDGQRRCHSYCPPPREHAAKEPGDD